MGDEIRQVLLRFKDDLPTFAKMCLQIETKNAEKKPLIFNETQKYLHKRVEEHKQKHNGKVRVVVLKARQQGISTYTEARFFWKTFLNCSTRCFIMAHESDSTSSIFKMVKRFYDDLQTLPKPPLTASNFKELIVASTGSSYRVATAGNTSAGRSQTNQLLHCSEVGFFEKADEIMAGLFQTVPDNNQSEILLESTANGVGGFFYDKFMAGLGGDGDWESIFIPWFMSTEYQRTPPVDFRMTDEELELKGIYGLTPEQIYWRRCKITNDFKGREHIFKQEYPSSFQEAFVSTQNALLPGFVLEKAKACNNTDEVAPVVMGVDPARNGDRTAICIRKGREIIKIIVYEDMESQRLAGICKNLIEKYQVAKCFIDVGCGYGTIDRLESDGYGHIVSGIPFNSGANDKRLYSNKRSEIFGEMRDWFMQDGWVSIPNDDEVVKELSILPDMRANANGQWVMLPKDEIKKENGGKSTDLADAIALTFAEKVGIINIQEEYYSDSFFVD